jgi:hypothetical protein
MPHQPLWLLVSSSAQVRDGCPQSQQPPLARVDIRALALALVRPTG